MMDTELLEWRDHDSVSAITHTGFGPYLVESLGRSRFRVWLPDDAGAAKVMVEGLRSDEEAKAFCQRHVDGRRALRFVAEAQPAYSDADELRDLQQSIMACSTLADLRSVQITIQRIREAGAA